MKNILIIKHNNNEFEKFYNDKCIENGAELKEIESFYTSMQSPIVRVWDSFRVIKKEILERDYDKIIVFEDIFISLALIFVPQIRKKTHIWLWNTVTEHQKRYIKILKTFFKVWSFDDKDVEKYKLNKNEQFYFFDSVNDEIIITKPRVMFVGVDKGRFEFAALLYDLCKKNNIDSFFYIVKDKNVKYPSGYESILFDEYISYHKIMDEIKKSTVIVDLAKSSQYGYTARAMEALYEHKKIITNNVKFISDFFYNENNILVLEKFDEKSILRFMEKDFVGYNEEVYSYFDFKRWIERFK